MIYFLLRLPQLRVLDNLYRRIGPRMGDRMKRLPYGDLFDRIEIPTGVYIFTGLSQLGPAHEAAALQVWDQLEDTGSVLLNRPGVALNRIQLLETLRERGLNSFSACRSTAYRAGLLRFPVFIRSNRLHNGALSPLLTSEAQLDAALEKARSRGYPPDDLLVVEYCDTRDDDGYVRKYSAYRIRDRIIPCHLEHGLDAFIKRGTSIHKAGSPDLAAEELRYVRENPHLDQLAEAFDLARIEYGRVDYGVRNGRVQIWEINTAPSFGRNPKKIDEDRRRERMARATQREIYYGMIADTLLELDDLIKAGSCKIGIDGSLRPLIRRELRFEKAVVQAKWLRDKARRMGLGNLGRLMNPLDRLVSRMLHRYA